MEIGWDAESWTFRRHLQIENDPLLFSGNPSASLKLLRCPITSSHHLDALISLLIPTVS